MCSSDLAKEVAITDDCKYVKIEDIENKLRDGKRGIGGTGARRKKKEKYQEISDMVLIDAFLSFSQPGKISGSITKITV